MLNLVAYVVILLQQIWGTGEKPINKCKRGGLDAF